MTESQFKKGSAFFPLLGKRIKHFLFALIFETVISTEFSKRSGSCGDCPK
jgi:hypothetical protein